jgi:hypothetical protein
MKTTCKPGYILMFTLALVALFMFIASYVANRSLVFNAYMRTMIDQEKARQLAFGGIQCAIAQLMVEQKKEEPKAEQQESSAQKKDEAQKKENAQEKKEPKQSQGQLLLQAILPTLNRVQEFKLKKKTDGIDGTLALVIGSEEGKINLNKLYDFEKHKFVGEGQPQGDMRQYIQQAFASIKDDIGADLFEPLEKFLKQRKYPLNDVTELLTIPEFAVFKNTIFYNPFDVKKSAEEKPTVYLTDIFTIYPLKREIQPWLLSASLMKQDTEKKQDVSEILKKFKDQTNWKTDWDTILKPLYNVEFKALNPSFVSLLSANFDPKFFSVMSRGTVNKVSVTVWAFLELGREGSGKESMPIIRIRQVYML